MSVEEERRWKEELMVSQVAVLVIRKWILINDSRQRFIRSLDIVVCQTSLTTFRYVQLDFLTTSMTTLSSEERKK